MDQLLNMTIGNDFEWTYLEKCMMINDGKINDSFYNIHGNEFAGEFFRTGIVIEKIRNTFLVTSYNIKDGVCIIGHRSKHGKNYETLGGYVNMFSHIEDFEGKGDGHIEQLFDELLASVIESDDLYFCAISANRIVHKYFKKHEK